jgi:hypothetical protein
VLNGIATYGVKWEDRYTYVKSPKDPLDPRFVSPVRTLESAAPPFDPRMVRVLSRLGGGDLHAGLQLLHEHPRFWTNETEAQYQGQRVKLSADLERMWRSAWMGVVL